jgi:hypothetical protein
MLGGVKALYLALHYTVVAVAELSQGLRVGPLAKAYLPTDDNAAFYEFLD